jgi:hypothetical protein
MRTIQDLHYYGHPPGRACFELRILDFQSYEVGKEAVRECRLEACAAV